MEPADRPSRISPIWAVDAPTRSRMAGMRGADDARAACAGIVEMICGDRYTSPQEQTVLVELYSYGSLDAQVGVLRRQWQDRSQEALAAHFDRDTSRALDALLEGWALHRGFGDFRADRRAVEQAVHRIAGLEPAQWISAHDVER